MRLAWFHPGPVTAALDASDAVDVSLELGRTHTVDQFDDRRAHDFVWRNFRQSYDLTVFELGDTGAHAFVWPYLFQYPGIVVLHARSVQRSRSQTLLLSRRHDDLRAERRFSHGNLLGAPAAAARLVVVHDPQLASDLRDSFPGLTVRVIPTGVAAAPLHRGDRRGRFHVAGHRHDVVRRAATRAAGAGLDITAGGLDPLGPDDLVIALDWPPAGGPPPAALRAMAAGLPVIVLETESVAAWPTLDPQTWLPRGYVRDVTPIAISIDPRDEEHSLMLAMRRLAGDADLRARLGRAALAWTRQHASVRAAAAAWEPVLQEAAAMPAPATGTKLPPHLIEDGTRTARRILGEFGAAVDFLES